MGFAKGLRYSEPTRMHASLRLPWDSHVRGSGRGGVSRGNDPLTFLLIRKPSIRIKDGAGGRPFWHHRVSRMAKEKRRYKDDHRNNNNDNNNNTRKKSGSSSSLNLTMYLSNDILWGREEVARGKERGGKEKLCEYNRRAHL